MSFPSFTPANVVTQVLMMRSAFGGAILLIEGERDRRFWEARIDLPSCRVVLCGGKSQALAASGILNDRAFAGFLAVVDADLDGIVGPVPAIRNVYVLDAHDLEAMLLRSSALEYVLAECGDLQKIQEVETRTGKSLRDLLLERCLVFARLRWWLHVGQANVPFEQFRPTRHVDPQSWTVDEAGVIAEVARVLGCAGDAVVAGLATCPRCDPWSLCHGKDLIGVLDSGLQVVLGRQRPGHERIAALLRCSLDRTSLFASRIASCIMEWEAANPAYRVLKK